MNRSVVTAALAAAVFVVPLATASATTAPRTSANLIVNGDAEAAIARPVPGWTHRGGLGVQADSYGQSGLPAFTDLGPPNRGTALFVGGWPPIGVDDRLEVATQTRPLTAFARSIDAGTATYTLSGWLGGYNDQRDYATLEINFYATGTTPLGTARIGPVTPTQRHQLRGLLKRTQVGSVPVGSRRVMVTLTLRRLDGGYNDGYADNLSLTITTP